MAKSKKFTYKRLLTFHSMANFFLVRDKNNSMGKFAYAIQKIANQYDSIFAKYNSEEKDLLDKYQSTDEHGNLAYDIVEKTQFPCFTPANKTKYRKAKEALLEKWLTKEFEIEPYMANDIPKDLSFNEIDAFTGLILPDDYDPFKNSEEK